MSTNHDSCHAERRPCLYGVYCQCLWLRELSGMSYEHHSGPPLPLISLVAVDRLFLLFHRV